MNKIEVQQNADNKELMPFGGQGVVVGYVDNVNGKRARECPEYVTTLDELEQLALYWMNLRLQNKWIFFYHGQTGSSETRENRFAMNRVARIEAILGEEKVQQLWDEAYAMCTQQLPPEVANAFRYGGTSEAVEEWLRVSHEN